MAWNMHRRSFLAGTGSAVLGLANAGMPRLVFGQGGGGGGNTGDIFIQVFLRGGFDSLNLVVPFNDSQYISKRSEIGIPAPGQSGGAIDLNGQFGFHPSAGGLKTLWDLGDLAIVHAAGTMNPTRSHFDAQDFLEKGVPGDKGVQTGWLKRHLDTVGTPAVMRAVSVGSNTSTALRGDVSAISMTDAEDFVYEGEPWQQDLQMRLAVRRMYQGNTWLEEVANQALDTSDIIETAAVNDYTPEFGASYPNTTIANHLKLIAQVTKLNLGLQVATVDMGGWDTHNGQSGTFNTNVTRLSQALEAFWIDMTNHHGNVTLVVISEFGRRLKENANAGTDHGHGWEMMVLGGAVQGGQFYGQWPGLEPENLDNSVDLAITTDCREVFAEIMLHRLGNNQLDYTFPGFAFDGGTGIFGSVMQPVQQMGLVMM